MRRAAAAPDGTLFAVCGYFTQVGGSQDKAVFVSSDHGASWSLRGSCLRAPSPTCASGTLGDGDLGTLDAVSATLDTPALADMVKQVVVDKKDASVVAKEWLTSAGLI